ncbi:HNH endonuclease, partial [Tessaracoccus sp. SD287]|uniref:HNH endonuclease signature motif containing protein n=1 Tax=Tessaracoccus sp. SD287 TaxID=2782008 RepID=UPI001A97022D
NTHATLADGLLHVATQSLAAVPASRRDGYRVLIHLDTDGVGWLGRTGALPSTLRDAYTCDGVIRPVWHTDGVPVAVGRSMRIVPNRTRRLIEDRDQGCRYPGCPATGFLENHHLIHWNQGGDTDPPNLLSLCPFHHRSHHLGDYQISGDPTRPDGLTFTTAHGHPIQPVHRDVPPVMPERPAPIRDVVRGERLESWSVQFSPPPEPDPDAETEPAAEPVLPERPDDVDPDNWAILMRIVKRQHAHL